MGDAKSIDPAAIEMLAHAESCGIGTGLSRASEMKPCPIGEVGACCRICSMGPCRLVGKDAESKTGICGADLPTVASRHFARQVAAGVAAHSDHGRDIAQTLLRPPPARPPTTSSRTKRSSLCVAGYGRDHGPYRSRGRPGGGREALWRSSASRRARS